VDALLSGILVTTGLYSVNLAIMGRSNLPLIQAPSLFSVISLTDDPVTNQTLLLTMISILAVILLTWLLSTDFGLAMRATGDNEQMIRAFGVNTDRMKVIGLALANGLTALSGYLITYVQGYADINMGIGIVLLGIGAVMIGVVLSQLFRIQKIRILLVSVLAGSVLFRLILGVALTLGIDPLYLKLVVACFVLVTVSLPRLRAAS
jgi:putative ABC transport system permease protein